MRICTHRVLRTCTPLEVERTPTTCFVGSGKGVVVWTMLIDLMGAALRSKSQGNPCFCIVQLAVGCQIQLSDAFIRGCSGLQKYRWVCGGPECNFVYTLSEEIW